MREKICFYMPPYPSVRSYFDMVDVSCEYGLKYIEGFNILDFETPDTEKAKKTPTKKKCLITAFRQ